MTDENPPTASPFETPTQLLSDLFQTVPRFVERTRNQAELVALVASKLPCVGQYFAPSEPDDAPEVASEDTASPNDHERVPIDVLRVLESDAAGSAGAGGNGSGPVASGPASSAPAPSATAAPAATGPDRSEGLPSEADMPIQDYDSLAASQVVPRLATMTQDELLVVQRYERAHRGRQTILNRISQRLDT